MAKRKTSSQAAETAHPTRKQRKRGAALVPTGPARDVQGEILATEILPAETALAKRAVEKHLTSRDFAEEVKRARAKETEECQRRMSQLIQPRNLTSMLAVVVSAALAFVAGTVLHWFVCWRVIVAVLATVAVLVLLNARRLVSLALASVRGASNAWLRHTIEDEHSRCEKLFWLGSAVLAALLCLAWISTRGSSANASGA